MTLLLQLLVILRDRKSKPCAVKAPARPLRHGGADRAERLREAPQSGRQVRRRASPEADVAAEPEMGTGHDEYAVADAEQLGEVGGIDRCVVTDEADCAGFGIVPVETALVA